MPCKDEIRHAVANVAGHMLLCKGCMVVRSSISALHHDENLHERSGPSYVAAKVRYNHRKYGYEERCLSSLTCLSQLYCKLSQQGTFPFFGIFTMPQHYADVLHLSLSHIPRRHREYSVHWLAITRYVYFTRYVLNCSAGVVLHPIRGNNGTKSILYVPLKPDHGVRKKVEEGCRSVVDSNSQRECLSRAAPSW